MIFKHISFYRQNCQYKHLLFAYSFSCLISQIPWRLALKKIEILNDLLDCVVISWCTAIQLPISLHAIISNPDLCGKRLDIPNF